MKKTALLFVLCLSFGGAFAENESLLDVNYDSPENTLDYDESVASFQQIYLQYESAIKKLEEQIKESERQSKNSEIIKVKDEEKQNIEAAVAKAREDFYQNEAQDVRAKETARLTNEITEKLTKELTEKFISEYEAKLKENTAAKEKEIRSAVSLENESLEKKFKEDVRSELSSEYEAKLKDDIATKETELRNTISLENEALEKKLKEEVRHELSSEYEAKKNNEIRELKPVLRRQVEKESKAATARLRIISPFCFAAVAILILALLLRWLVPFIKKISDSKNDEEKKLRKRENNIKAQTGTYLERIREFGGKSASLQDEIDKETDEQKKQINLEALNRAREEYKKTEYEKSIGDYQKEFETLKNDFDNILKKWSQLGEEGRNLLFDALKKNCSEWRQKGYNLEHSRNDKDYIGGCSDTFRCKRCRAN